MKTPLDYTIEELEDGTFTVWTPDISVGACIGEGATRQAAIADAMDGMGATIEALRNVLTHPEHDAQS